MVVARSPGRGLLRWEQRLDQVPLGVGQPRLDHRRWRCSAREGQGSLTGDTPRGVTARGNRLVGPAPPRPCEPERPLLGGFAQSQDQPAHLRHRERNQVGINAPFWANSSRRAA